MQRNNKKGYKEYKKWTWFILKIASIIHINEEIPCEYEKSIIECAICFDFFSFILKIDFCLFKHEFLMCICNKRLFHIANCNIQCPIEIRNTFDYVSNIHSYRLLIEPEIALDFSIFRFSEFQRTDILRIADDFRNSDEFDCWQWILYFQQP